MISPTMHTRWHSVCVCVDCVCVCCGGGGILKLKSHKRGGYSETEKSQSAKISDNFHLRGGGILKLKSHKVPRSLTISIFGGGGGILKLSWRIGVFCRIWTKFSTTPAGSCITDSLSHTTYVETNQHLPLQSTYAWSLTNPIEIELYIEIF